MLLAATYLAQQYRGRIAVLLWQRFQYLLCWQRKMYVNNTRENIVAVPWQQWLHVHCLRFIICL